MADRLYLSLWFPNFRFAALPQTMACVLRQVPSSPERPGVAAAAVYPITWSGAHVYQRVYDTAGIPEDAQAAEELELRLDAAVHEATEMMHEDYAYEFEMYWDLWMPSDEAGGRWVEQPGLLRVAGFGPQFEDAAFEQNGQVRIELGPDTPFLYEEDTHVPEVMLRVQQNVARLLDLTSRIEKHCGVSSRLLWSDGDSSLAQKLLDGLQKLN